MLSQDLAFQQLPTAQRRLRVAVVTETYPPEINGVALTIGLMVRALQTAGHQVQLIRPRQSPLDRPDQEANLEQLLRPGLAIPRYSGLKMGLPAKAALLRRWSVQRPDVVHIVTEGPLGWSALAAARKLRIPVTSDFHTNFHAYTRHYGIGWLKKPIGAYLRKFHNQTEVTLVPSQTLRRDLEAAGYRNLQVVSRGVDAALFSPARRSRTLRASWGLRDDDLAVICVGRIAAEKNQPLLVRAFEAVAKHHPSARLVLVGDGPEAEPLKARHPRLIFCGARRGEDLATHFASADVFLFPSLTETFGNVVLEAMASGLAVLGFDYAAAAEHIEHGVNGLKCPFGVEDDFVAQALTITATPALRRKLGERARETALGLSWDAIFREFEATLFGVVQASEAADEHAALGLEADGTR